MTVHGRGYKYAGPKPFAAAEDSHEKRRPSIAVLPFTNMSGDPAQDYFSDGITEDIITELSYFRQLFVTARNSSFQYRDKAVDIRRVAHELGVQYVVEGSARKAGNRVRVTAQLIDGATGNNVWAERYDRDLHDILTVQSDLAHAIATRVSGRADRHERARAVTLDPTNLHAYDCYLRGVHHWLRLTREDNEKARHELEAAIRLDPTLAEAYAELGQCHAAAYYAWWVKDRAAALTTALNLAKRAVELDEGSSRCRWTLGLAHLFRGDYDLARLHLETGIELNPNDTRLRAIYGAYLVAVGRVDEAIQQYEIAAQLDPRDQYWIPWLRGSALFVARRYAEAIDSFKQMADPINEVRGWLAASLAHAGRLQEAAAMLDEFLRVAEREMEDFPGQRLKDWESYWQDTTKFQHRADLDHLLDGLHKAGLPH
jgi:TolB-like protein/Tfp pilus assembly protein PilF